MPIYEYRCQACGVVIEAMQRMSDAPLVRCDKCGADALQRLISQTSFHLKGSGWYVTDYKSKPASERGDGGGGASKGESKKSDAGSDGGGAKADAPKSEPAAPAPKKAD